MHASADLDPSRFEVGPDGPDDIRVADELLLDLLFAANGQTFESLQSHVRHINVCGVSIATLDIDGLLKTKTDYRDKDRIDIQALKRLKQGLEKNNSRHDRKKEKHREQDQVHCALQHSGASARERHRRDQQGQR